LHHSIISLTLLYSHKWKIFEEKLHWFPSIVRWLKLLDARRRSQGSRLSITISMFCSMSSSNQGQRLSTTWLEFLELHMKILRMQCIMKIWNQRSWISSKVQLLLGILSTMTLRPFSMSPINPINVTLLEYLS